MLKNTITSLRQRTEQLQRLVHEAANSEYHDDVFSLLVESLRIQKEHERDAAPEKKQNVIGEFFRPL